MCHTFTFRKQLYGRPGFRRIDPLCHLVQIHTDAENDAVNIFIMSDSKRHMCIRRRCSVETLHTLCDTTLLDRKLDKL